ncbi:LysR substrate-binding domain-containing protein [Acidipila sp. EB88]|uniref:LysR substrate-binding domain-containing protein n=1 Tax=Acidipila sp. EB88 TaxID=2305226 RepID=UPI000F5DEB8A|nr:LysR substrate-binding domain-containing protein [Acidipila sp. EB88]RRA47396.1 LysR family transcriptional regulator [Acidipila sp. EB88]
MIENFRLHVFRSVARHLNFSRAAEELLLTQPAVTQQIKALEDELGVALFDRGGGHVQLTPGGRALVPFAEKLRALAEEASTAVAAACGQQGGELALGASQTIAQYLLPALIATFRKSHPRVRVTTQSGNTDTMLDALVAGRIQLALVEGPDRRRDLQIEHFMEDHMVLVVPPAHEWAGEEVTIGMLREEPLLLREFGSGSRRVIEQALAARGLRAKDLKVSMELDSTEGLLSAVEAGLGVAFVSRWAVRNQLALGTLRLAYARELKLARWLSVARALGPDTGGGAEAFRALLLSGMLEPAPRRTGASRSPRASA